MEARERKKQDRISSINSRLRIIPTLDPPRRRGPSQRASMAFFSVPLWSEDGEHGRRRFALGADCGRHAALLGFVRVLVGFAFHAMDAWRSGCCKTLRGDASRLRLMSALSWKLQPLFEGLISE
jgi:hypothetical protein